MHTRITPTGLILFPLIAWLHASSPAFAGPSSPPITTVITHGYSPDSKGIWVRTMCQAILARTGGSGAVYRYTGSTGSWTRVPEAGGDGSHQHVMLIFNWVPESASVTAGPNWNYAQAAGDALYATLREPVYTIGSSGPADVLTDRAVHFLGHSRGACVISEAIRRLALAGIAVDQMTAHDPHPVNGTLDAPYNFDWGDPVPVCWSNVAFADNYWRADGGGLINGLDFDGIPLDNTHNVMLNETALNCCAYSFAHLDVHLWYHGTIDLSPAPCDGEQCINATMRNTWWPEGYTQRGYYYAASGGGAAQRPAIPPGVAPSPDSAPIIENGGFTQGTYAGWSYHGGSGANLINQSGNFFARLTNTAPALTHNRSFLPGETLRLTLSARRNGTGSTDDVLRIRLQRANDAQPIEIAGATINVAELTSAFAAFEFDVPAAFAGRTCRLSFALDGMTSGITSAVDLDNITVTIIPPTSMPGDLNNDGIVGPADLGILLGSWGNPGCAGPPPPTPCPADLNNDGAVGPADLAILLGNWG